MNKQELVKAISTDTGLTQVDINKVVNSLEKLTLETVGKGEKVQITGFVNIRPVYRSPRKGYDPINHVPMDIPATVGVSVRAGEKLRGAVKKLDVKDFEPTK